MKVLALFRVDGRPRTKGSLSVYCRKDRAHSVHVQEEVAESKAWRARVAAVARAHQRKAYGEALKYAGPVEVRAVFYFAQELSKALNAPPGTVIPSHMTPFPTDVKLGDLDKLMRNIGDALAMPQRKEQAPRCAGLILDDSQITDEVLAKRWTSGTPYAEIMVVTSEDTGRPSWMPEGIQ